MSKSICALQRGFTLIEAMVALVILGSTGMALFSWINASIVSLRRVEDANARSAATSNAIEYMQSVNPMQRPEGRVDLGQYRLEWTSQRDFAVVDGSGLTLGPSNFQLALFATHVRVLRPDDGIWFELRLKLVGYKKVRGLTNLAEVK